MGYKRRTSVVTLWSIDKYQPNLMILAYSNGVCLTSNGLSLCGKQLPMDVGYFERVLYFCHFRYEAMFGELILLTHTHLDYTLREWECMMEWMVIENPKRTSLKRWYMWVNYNNSLTWIVQPYWDTSPDINQYSRVRENSEAVTIYHPFHGNNAESLAYKSTSSLVPRRVL